MILRSDREWLETVNGLAERDLPCNGSTVAYAVAVAVRAVEAHDGLLAVLDELLKALPEPTNLETLLTDNQKQCLL